jgi:hypothetical protein
MILFEDEKVVNKLLDIETTYILSILELVL